MRGLVYALFLTWTLTLATTALAYAPYNLYAGLGLYSQNTYNGLAKSSDGTSGVLGELSYPFLLKFDVPISDEWYWAPQINYTLISRKITGDAGSVTTLHLGLPFGQNFNSGGVVYDWFFGPGLTVYSYEGKSGSVPLSNGTGTSYFAQPGRSVSVKKLTMDLGSSINFSPHRVGLELIFENLLSNQKRTQTVYLNYSYAFWGPY